jgi:hypothetical protein
VSVCRRYIKYGTWTEGEILGFPVLASNKSCYGRLESCLKRQKLPFFINYVSFSEYG